MNIFVVDQDPIVSAQSLCDKHVVKMIVEGCQMLSTIHHLHGSTEPSLYKPSFKNHPCTVWARASLENYFWLAKHTWGLSLEYSKRYEKIHKASDLCYFFMTKPPKISSSGLTPFAQAMPDKYRDKDAVKAYRQYYINEKAKFAKWKLGNTPEWFTEGLNDKLSSGNAELTEVA